MDNDSSKHLLSFSSVLGIGIGLGLPKIGLLPPKNPQSSGRDKKRDNYSTVLFVSTIIEMQNL